MVNNNQSLGLVLSGGGARGAYEAGVVRFLAEAGIEPTMYAGASVGALNGAFLAAAPNFKQGASRLGNIWHSISRHKMLEINPKLIGIGLLYTAFGTIATQNQWKILNQVIFNGAIGSQGLKDYLHILQQSPLKEPVERGVLSNGMLETLLHENISNDALEAGKPLWISVYESHGAMVDLLELFAAGTFGVETKPAKYLHLQSLHPEQRVQALLASAALPLVYDNQVIENKKYRDGGMGEIRTSKGNTPLKPLVQAGCKQAIVVHISHGSLWDRHQYPDVQIIEVRPRKSLYSEGKLVSLMNFNEDKIHYLIEQGYEDARYCLGNVINALKVQTTVQQAKHEMTNSIKRLRQDDLNEYLSKLD